MERKQPQEKSSTSGKKIKMTKSITNVEQKNPTQEILLSFEYIRKENRHLNLNLIFIIVKYVSIYIRSIYFIRFFFCKQTYLHSSVTQSKRDNSSQIINYKKNFKKYLKKIIHSLLMPPSKHYRTSSFKQVVPVSY
jgi:hypothetical protein